MHFGGTQNDAVGVYESPLNDGYYLIGLSNSDISGDKTANSRGGYDVWIIKTDLNFNILWDKTIGGSMDDLLSDVKIENNKIYISCFTESGVSGEKTSANNGSYDIWMLCLDLSGNIIWQNQYGGTDGDSNAKIIDYKPNSFLLTAQSRSPISGNKTVGTKGFDDIWLVEISKTDGQILNQKNIGTTSDDKFPNCVKSNNHLYLVCVTQSDTISGDKTDPGFGFGGDIWLVKLDLSLNIIQDKCFGGTGTEEFPKIVKINNNFYISSNSNSNPSGNKTAPNYSLIGRDGWVINIDENLNIIWDKSYGGNADERIGKVFQNINGNLVLSLSSQSIPSGNKTSPRYGMSYDCWVLITDNIGNIVAQVTYGGTEDEYGGVSPFLNSNNELLLIANSSSGISGNKTVPTNGNGDAWIAKIDASNFLNTEKITNTSSTISVYPNPFTDKVHFDFNDLREDAVLTLFSADGKKIFETAIVKGQTTFSWSPENAEQFFLYQLKGNSFQHQGKVVKK